MMKPRRVVVRLEIHTDLPAATLKKKALWNEMLTKWLGHTGWCAEVVQNAEINVIQQAKPTSRRSR